MATKLNNAGKKTIGGAIGLAIMGWVLIMSLYSMYFVARHGGVPKFFAAGFSVVYDGCAMWAGYKSLQYAQEGRSGISARVAMAAFVAISAWMNSLHAILGGESKLFVPFWAGLPIAAAWMFELHTSQARAKALARIGKKYPAPLPSWGGVTWSLFPLATMDKLRFYVAARAEAMAITIGWEPRKMRKARNAGKLPAAVPAQIGASRPGSASGSAGNATARPASAAGSASAGSATADEGDNATPDADTAAEETSAHDSDHSATQASASATAGASRRSASSSNITPFPGSATRECEHCHEQFVPLRKTARYCGSNCRTAACRARKAEAS